MRSKVGFYLCPNHAGEFGSVCMNMFCCSWQLSWASLTPFVWAFPVHCNCRADTANMNMTHKTFAYNQISVSIDKMLSQHVPLCQQHFVETFRIGFVGQTDLKKHDLVCSKQAKLSPMGFRTSCIVPSTQCTSRCAKPETCGMFDACPGKSVSYRRRHSALFIVVMCRP